jgi:hypothetical protein
MNIESYEESKLMNLLQNDASAYMTFLYAVHSACIKTESFVFFTNLKIAYVKRDGTIAIDFKNKTESCRFNVKLKDIELIGTLFKNFSFWDDFQKHYLFFINLINKSLEECYGQINRTPVEKLKDILESQQKKHGDSSGYLRKISKYWSKFTGKKLSNQEVCIMIALLKLAIAEHTKKGCYDEDLLLDIAGYCVLAVEQE